jgi:D-tyrosyl-tRNA(Tyr) deacylase
MMAVVQRVARARVESEGEDLGAIGPGMLVLLCALRGDRATEARRLAERIARFRFFPDAGGRMNVSALDRGLEVLVVSQFTLAADGKRGRRPSFDRALPPAEASELCDTFVSALRELGLRVATGRFGARMQVELVNDGPVTFLLEERPEPLPRGSTESQIGAG